ncbi:hypothetical protein Acr_00g0005010 [Actinidia rufa]|uniref:Uncharacterized protein n=1 Tax=Actinidia rufa TaxID=165716 RepID=A0A7J0D7N5_9ERIC|nr:hypothetical protein Acr_00g0005010 [Actinidia rufa]
MLAMPLKLRLMKVSLAFPEVTPRDDHSRDDSMDFWTGTSVNPGVVLGLEAFALDNPTMAEKLLQGDMLPINKETVAMDMEGRMAELEADKQCADEELKKFKEEYDVAMEKHEKEMA